MDNKIKAKALSKLQTLRQGIRSFCNFIDEFERFVLEAGETLDDKIKKALYKKALKKELVLIFIGIDSNLSFDR